MLPITTKEQLPADWRTAEVLPPGVEFLELEYAQPGFSGGYQEIDTFNLYMSPELESTRIGYSSQDFHRKAFTRIVPPYTPYRRLPSENDSSTSAPSPVTSTPTYDSSPPSSTDSNELVMAEDNVFDEEFGIINHSDIATTQDETETETIEDLDSPPLIDKYSKLEDPHLYLRTHIDPEWEAPAFREWVKPTKRVSSILTAEEDNSKIMFLRIDMKICNGSTWDIFRGDMRLCDGIGTLQPIVLKLTKLTSFKESSPDIVLGEDVQPIRDIAIDRIINEDLTLRENLSTLQGDLVPFYYGLFVWHGIDDDDDDENWIIAMIMEDVGNPVYHMMSFYPIDIRKAIFDALYRVLEDGNITHGDMNPRHILDRDFKHRRDLHCKEKFVLIDFKLATSLEFKSMTERQTVREKAIKILLWQLDLKENDSKDLVSKSGYERSDRRVLNSH